MKLNRLIKESDRKITIISCLWDDFACFNTLFWQNFELQAITWACQEQTNITHNNNKKNHTVMCPII